MEKKTKPHMEYSAIHQSFFTSPYHFIPENYVHWTETPESHIYSADLPDEYKGYRNHTRNAILRSQQKMNYFSYPVSITGVKKEEIRVEVEDSRYLIIRTEEAAAKKFMRKFRLPERIDIDGISAGYENGVLTVKVLRSFVRRGLFIEADDLPQPEQLHVIARAA